MRADKHYVTGEIPLVINPTNPVAIRMADIVANVHMHDALRSHRSASLVGRMVRTNRSLLRWAVGNVAVVLVVLTVIGFIYTGISGGAR